MNLFSDYKKKILIYLKKLGRKKIIHLPKVLNNFTVELPPKGHEAEISCNVALVLAKINVCHAKVQTIENRQAHLPLVTVKSGILMTEVQNYAKIAIMLANLATRKHFDDIKQYNIFKSFG